MTTRRVIASLSASAAGLALVATLAVRSFPLQAQGQDQMKFAAAQEAGPVQIIAGGDQLREGGLSEYSTRGAERRVEGDVMLDLTTDERGEVTDVRIVSGPDELRRAALESALRWHFTASGAPSASRQVTLRFNLSAFEALRATRERERTTEHGSIEGTRRLVQIRSERVGADTMKELSARTNAHIGDEINESTAAHIREIATTLDEHVRVTFASDGRGGVIVTYVNS